jgi:hypothetical protein
MNNSVNKIFFNKKNLLYIKLMTAASPYSFFLCKYLNHLWNITRGFSCQLIVVGVVVVDLQFLPLSQGTCFLLEKYYCRKKYH